MECIRSMTTGSWQAGVPKDDPSAIRSFEATRQFTSAGLPPLVLVLTTYDRDQYVHSALKAGAAGFLLTATPPDRLGQGIETVAVGRHCSHRTSPGGRSRNTYAGRSRRSGRLPR